jgi:hypothetical protein
MVDITKVHRDQMCVVPAGEPHMFTALEDTRALEIYWAELNHNDIHRDLIGGINENDSPSLFQNELKKVQTVFN